MSSLLALLGGVAAVGLACVIFGLLTWALRGREGFWPDVLGLFTRIFVSCALGTALLALAVTLWLIPAERHRVSIAGVGDGDAPVCTFTWPSTSAPADQSALCPGSNAMRGDDANAVRLPGTDQVVLAGGRVDPFTSAALWGVGFFMFAALIGGGLNARPDKRWREAQDRNLRRAWAAGGPPPAASLPVRPGWSGRDDLDWQQIAAASEAPGKHAGPLDTPQRVSTPTPAQLPMGYPLPYLRIVTRPADAPHRSVLLFFVEGGAWWTLADGQPPRTGNAVITGNPAQPRDLAVEIGEGTIDLGDAPMFFTTDALEALRRATSRWASA